MLFIKDSPRLPLPEFMPGEDGGAITFGVELEGLADVQRVFKRYQKSLTSNIGVQHSMFARELQDAGFNASTGLKAGYWHVKFDDSIARPKHLIRTKAATELASPILAGDRGLGRVDNLFQYLDRAGFESHPTCALQIHVSLGWDKDDLDQEATREQVENIHEAFVHNAPFFLELMDETRYDNPYCTQNLGVPHAHLMPNMDGFITAANPPEGQNPSKNFMLNLTPLPRLGTVEYRFKEADNYPSSIGFLRFMVAFTYEAAQNREIRTEAVLDKYFERGSCVTIRSIPPRYATLGR